MSSLDIIFTIVVIANLGFIMAQEGINELNPQNNFINCSNTILSEGGCSSPNQNQAFGSNGIPSAPTASTGGNGFTDIFNTIGTWFKSGFGGKLLAKIFSFYTLLSWTGMDVGLVALIGSAWYLFSFWAVIEWWRGIG